MSFTPPPNISQFSIFNDLSNSSSSTSEIPVSTFKRLSIEDASNLYRSNRLARKIVELFPKTAFNFGYELHDNDGNIIEKDNDIVLNAFLEASIHSRIYGHCFIYFELSDNKIDKPVTSDNLQITGYKLFFRMYDRRDFWEKENQIYHKDRVILFHGLKNFINLDYVFQNEDISIFYDSVLDSLAASLYDNFMSKSYAKYILENLSYLLVGMTGLSAKVASNLPEGRNALQERMKKINAQKNVSRIFAYDLNNEDIKFITQTLSGVKELIAEFKESVSAESGIPYDKLFEAENSSSMGGSGIQNQLVARFLWAEKKHDWAKENWLVKYKELFTKLKKVTDTSRVMIPFGTQLTDLEKAELQNLGADRIKKLIESGVISANEARTGYEGDEYSLNISLEKNPILENKKSSISENITQTENKITNEDVADFFKSISNEDWDEIADIDFEDLEKVANELIIIGSANSES